MGYIRIIDSGYINPSNSGTKASSANRANSGTYIELKAAEFIPSLSKNISANPELTKNTPSEVNIGSLENMQFVLRCILNTNNSSDTVNIAYLLQMVMTDGYKLMYYHYTNTLNNSQHNHGQLIYRIAADSRFGHVFTAGEMTAYSLSYAYYHLHVLFNDIQLKNIGDNGEITYDLKGIVLPVPTSTADPS